MFAQQIQVKDSIKPQYHNMLAAVLAVLLHLSAVSAHGLII